MEKIIIFRDEYSWLSNFALLESPIVYEGISYPTVEHFYVGMKTLDKNLQKKVSHYPCKGLKKLGRTLPLRDDWNDVKDSVMQYALKHKFSIHNPTLRQKLIDTDGIYIQEGNWWGDKYWGVCLKTNQGKNKLGKFIMSIRNSILCNQE